MTPRYPYPNQTYVQNPESFLDVYQGSLGPDYWAFLTRPENVLLLKGATLLRQPAIVILGHRLVAEFGADLGASRAGKGFDRIKQALGKMVKDVLESLARQGRPPIALNTSLNGRGEPICATVEDALGFFLAHPVDALFVEDVRIERGSGRAS